MFRKLLVAFDGSPDSRNALRAGVDLAHCMGASLSILIVEEGLPVYATVENPWAITANAAMYETLERQRDEYYTALCREAQDMAQAQGVVVEPEVRAGAEVETIAAYVKEIGADLLLIGYHQHSALRDRFLGSTAHGLALTTPCSLLTVRSG